MEQTARDRGHWMKEGEEICQRIYMHSPWTQIIMAKARGGIRGWVEVGKGEGMRTSVIVSTQQQNYGFETAINMGNYSNIYLKI